MANIFNQPFGVTWRKALLSAPRLVPDSVLYLTSPQGPHPFIINIPSRGTHLIPLYAFIPPPLKSSSSGSNPSTKFPILVDFHGGGFIFGSCQEQAPFCSEMSRELGAIIISVDYRLGPAAQFPAAVEDAEDVLNAILYPSKPGYQELRKGMQENSKRKVGIDEERIGVSGFSSGGNLALNLALNIKSNGSEWIEKDWLSVFPKQFAREIPLLLYYPSFDARQLPSERTRPPGMEDKKGFLKSLELETRLMPTYLPREKAGHLRASPGLARIDGGGLHEKAKMMLVLPEMDTLAEQSDVWIGKVEKEGRSNDLVVEKVKGVVHGWTQFPDSWLSDEARKLKMDIFAKAKDFVAKSWEG